jgi:hypothetical protein
MRLLAVGAVCLTLPLLFSACSTFQRDWRRALAQPVPADDLQGPWEGFWHSDSNGHNGRLRCLISRLDDRQYRFRYHAVYWGILRFSYNMDAEVQRQGEAFEFQGAADLGRLAGGVYEYEGRATPSEFFSTYRSKYDHGIFKMARPGRPVQR